MGEPLSPSDFAHEVHGPHKEAGIFITWYWNLKDLNPENFGLYAITAGTGFYGYEFTPSGATAMLTGQILYNSGVPEVGVFSIGGRELPLPGSSDAFPVSQGAMAAQVAAYEAAYSTIATASSGGLINPATGAAASLLNAGVGAGWVTKTYGRPR